MIFYSDNDEFNPLPSPSVKPINQVAEQEKGKPFRTGFTFDMAEREHRGEYTCEVIRHASFTVEDEGEAELKLSYYVRVKGRSPYRKIEQLFIKQTAIVLLLPYNFQ